MKVNFIPQVKGTTNLSGRKAAEGYRGGSCNGCIPCDVHDNDVVRGTNGEIWTIKCNGCKKWGHNQSNCPS